mmetsp:Transcript_25961/g.61599  ORF Transcript_25961/g.61599 Transcript_25961/m.61599 type:complete len:220 (+) Transcript_25961:435-1094(+)|eukprot:CAMPEP_0113456246 /NCGR_PEP_ID=MMETSP0014_2-20120614/8788_1 /TAXON_ID=2857 /ORGANISM="Nitzschia sp." /LENGTH=219 /DNA_ID=CAMNT_0000347693 /DNA_START=268 /DNA_END=927 /DNA_ORIENTATION=+ /assembly_acc=CAM_ASM_000159
MIFQQQQDHDQEQQHEQQQMKRLREDDDGVVRFQEGNKKVKLMVVVQQKQTFAATASSSTSSNRRRVRTEQYMNELERHENVQRTCQFFLNGLANLRHSQQQQLVDPSAAAVLEQNLLIETTSHNQKFAESTNVRLQKAKESIQLKDSMTNIIGRAVVDGTDGPSSSSKSTLRHLNHGRETSKALLDHISSYVGVPSDDDVVDCQDLVKVIELKFSSTI